MQQWNGELEQEDEVDNPSNILPKEIHNFLTNRELEEPLAVNHAMHNFLFKIVYSPFIGVDDIRLENWLIT